MQFLAQLLFLFLSLVSFATAGAFNQRQNDTVQPWQLRNVSSLAPEGQPGVYPWNTINATISNPNTLVIGRNDNSEEATVPANNTGPNCLATFLRDDVPYGRRWPCENTADVRYGYWYMEVFEVPDGNTLNAFDLTFTFRSMMILGPNYYQRTYEGSVELRLDSEGGNMSGDCSFVGRCLWSLIDDLAPLPVDQQEI